MPQLLPPETDTIGRFENESPIFMRAFQDVERERAFGREEAQIATESIPQAAIPPAGGLTPQVPITKGGHTPVKPVGETAKILSIKEWGKLNHPDLAKRSVIPRVIAESLQAEYQQYVQTQQAAQKFEVDRAEADARVSRANTLATGGGTTRSRSGGPKIDIPPDVLKKAQRAMSRGDFDDPNVLFVAQAGGVDLSKGQTQLTDRIDTDTFQLQMQGALKRAEENPAVGFKATMQQFGALMAFASPPEREQIENFLRGVAPSPDQLSAARDAGEITPEETRAMTAFLFRLQSPQQQQATMASIARRRTQAAQTPLGPPTDELEKLKGQRASIKKFQSQAPARKKQAAVLATKQKLRKRSISFERAAIKNLKAERFNRVVVIDAETERPLPHGGRLSGNVFNKQMMTDEFMKTLIARGLRIPGLDDHLVDEKKNSVPEVVSVDNKNGTHSSELTMTVNDPLLNGGNWTVIPSLVAGKKLSQKEAIQDAIDRDLIYPGMPGSGFRFRTHVEADKFADERSKKGGAGTQGFIGKPRPVKHKN